MKKILIITVVMLLLCGLFAGAASLVSGRAAARDDAVSVRLEKPTRGSLVELVQAPGEIQPRTKVSISARISARIAQLPFEEGQRVKAGDVVVKLDATDLEAALKSAQARKAAEEAAIFVAKTRVRAQEAQVNAAETVLADALRDLNRQKELFTSHDVSQSVLDIAQRRYDEQNSMLTAARANLEADKAQLIVMQHNLEAAEADIVRARDNLSYTTIKSPIDGLITRLNAKAGELVVTGTMNNAGTVILEIADFSEMLLYARVDETDIASLREGQTARIHTQSYPDEVFAGVVERVALSQSGPSSSQMMGTSTGLRYFKVEILVKTNGKRFFSGLSADAEIETQRHQDVLKVPSQAVVGRPVDDLPTRIRENNVCVDTKKSQTAVVYRLIEGKATVTPVTVGPSDLTHTMIKAGLAESDAIVTGPYKVLESLRHEQKLKDEKATTRPTTQSTTASSTMPATTRASR